MKNSAAVAYRKARLAEQQADDNQHSDITDYARNPSTSYNLERIYLCEACHDNDDAGNRRNSAEHFGSSVHHKHDGDTVGVKVFCNARNNVCQACESSNAGT